MSGSVCSGLPTWRSAEHRRAGLPDFNVGTWFGLFFPKGTPESIIRRLNVATGEALGLKSAKDRAASLAYVPAIHALLHRQGVDARDKHGHDNGLSPSKVMSA
jgi:hypothetical protein